MEQAGAQGCDLHWGSCEMRRVSDSGPPDASVSRDSRLHSGDAIACVWRPPTSLERHLPQGFQIELECHRTLNGARHFLPKGDINGFILSASMGGAALFELIRTISKEERFTYRFMRLVYQLGPHMREHFARRFTSAHDLYVRSDARRNSDEHHLLPDFLVAGSGDNLRRWSPTRLIAQGREEAERRSVRRPDIATCIRLGLLAAARQNPLDVSELTLENSSAIVRLALFNDEGDQKEVESVLPMVSERLISTLERHSAHDTGEFRRWFLDHTDNIVHQIAKKKRDGGPIERSLVRGALLHLVFQSFQYVGDCVVLQMRAIRNTLQVPLNNRERLYFDRLFERNSCLGGLPLILLRDRIDEVREAVEDVWDNPADKSREGVLLRVLQWYGEMATRRREADRLHKRNRASRSSRPCGRRVMPVGPSGSLTTGSHRDRFQEIAAVLRAERGTTCNCRDTQDWIARLVTSATDSNVILLEDECAVCGHTERVEVSRPDFERAGATAESRR